MEWNGINYEWNGMEWINYKGMELIMNGMEWNETK